MVSVVSSSLNICLFIGINFKIKDRGTVRLSFIDTRPQHLHTTTRILPAIPITMSTNKEYIKTITTVTKIIDESKVITMVENILKVRTE